MRRAGPPKIDPSLDAFFFPRSVALIGASGEKGSLGYSLMNNLVARERPFAVYPVNKKYEAVLGQKCFGGIGEVPGQVDLACIVTPSTTVPDLVDQCGRSGVKGVVVVSGGFSEMGTEEGVRLQEGSVLAARRWGMRLCGPNCLGISSPSSGVYLGMFSPVVRPLPGGAAVLTQSAGVGHAIRESLWERGVGTRFWASTGNEADLKAEDFLRYFVSEPGVNLVVVYMEHITSAEAMRRIGSEARSLGKPIVVMKSGSSAAGSRAVTSHTGALAGRDQAYDAFFIQQAMLRTRTTAQLVNAAVALNAGSKPRVAGLGVVTNSGGNCAIVADACSEARIELPRLQPQTERAIGRRLKEWLRPELRPSVGNPFDVGVLTFDLDRYAEMVGMVGNDGGVDVVLCTMFGHGAAADRFSSRLVEISAGLRRRGKLLLCAWENTHTYEPQIVERFSKAGIPLYTYPEDAVESLTYLRRYSQLLSAARGRR